MPASAGLIAALSIFLAFLPETASAADRSLAIIDAGVQDSEDAPFVSPDYQFLPGDFVHFTFQIGGFSVRSEDRGATERVSLAYEAIPEDAKGIPLAQPISGTVQVELNPEDKNWIPRRRSSFLVPSFVAAGEFHIHIVAKDLFNKTETSKDIPFRVGGIVVHPSANLTLQNFRFLRQENDRQALDIAAYRPGDNVYATFEMVGYKLGAQNEYRLSYSFTVLRPDGKPYLAQPQAGEFTASSFYPAQFVPAGFTVTTSADSSRGQYVVLLTIRDLIGNQSYETKEVFSLE